MSQWKIALLVAVGAAVSSVLLILLVKLWNDRRKARAGPYKLKQMSSMSSSRRGTVPVNAFDWKDHPRLMSEALDKGWAAFGLALVGASTRMPQISWEIGSGTELMQVVKLNPGLPVTEVSSKSFQLLKSALPIPGPFHGYYSFPQQAYFEIWIGATAEGQRDPTDFECSKLMGESKSDRIKSNRYMAESRRSSKALAIGLVAGGSSSFSDVGTAGYYSTGQVVLNGAVYNSDERFKKRPWIQSSSSSNGSNNTCTVVVGCGFSPRLRQVFFTLNGEISCQVSCKSFDEFSYPLHAAIASNYEQVVTVNFGQSPFEFLPENSSRVADPSNCRTSSCRTKVAEYDSGDLFSMIGYSQELHRPPPSEAESELFEIVLDGDKAAVGAKK